MVDIHKQGDFPILLGDSLKDDPEPLSAYLGVRYNWIPKSGFGDYRAKLNNSANSYGLSYKQGSSHHEYVGWLSEEPDQNSQLALFYDRSKSAFVLERLAASFDLNLKSSSDLSAEQIRRHAKIERPKNGLEVNVDHSKQDDLFNDPDEEAPDDSNPFDYRHYLAEAKEITEKASHNTVGGRTPLPGARTPMSGLSSPMPGATNHFLSTTPQFAPTEIRSSKRKAEEPPLSRRKTAAPVNSKATKKAQAQTKSSKPKISAPPRQAKPLSSEVVVDSDDSSDDASAPSPPSKPQTAKAEATKSHTRITSSPHITINQGGLEIDEGSPPLSSKRQSRLNPDAFRSQTNTPSFNRPPASSARDDDIDMHDASDAEEDVENAKYLLPASDEESQDGDVEDLVLDEPEPKPEPEPLPAPKAKRRQSSTTSRRYSKPHAQAQLQSPPFMEDEEDDGGLAAELEAALEREAQMQAGAGADDNEEGGVGLGIGMGGGVEEESDISEEE